MAEVSSELTGKLNAEAKIEQRIIKFNDAEKEVIVCQVCKRIISKIAHPAERYSFITDPPRRY